MHPPKQINPSKVLARRFPPYLGLTDTNNTTLLEMSTLLIGNYIRNYPARSGFGESGGKQSAHPFLPTTTGRVGLPGNRTGESTGRRTKPPGIIRAHKMRKTLFAQGLLEFTNLQMLYSRSLWQVLLQPTKSVRYDSWCASSTTRIRIRFPDFVQLYDSLSLSK